VVQPGKGLPPRILRRSASPRLEKKRSRRIWTGIIGALMTIVTGLAIVFLTPPINQVGTKALHGWTRVVGADLPVELRPLCAGQGGIVAPPAEKDAAYHWRCRGSSYPITEQQIATRCHQQWGQEVNLVLRDRDASSGWKCHKRGWLR
jgi:hypothetical protein